MTALVYSPSGEALFLTEAEIAQLRKDVSQAQVDITKNASGISGVKQSLTANENGLQIVETYFTLGVKNSKPTLVLAT
jgi:hypothetical protein